MFGLGKKREQEKDARQERVAILTEAKGELLANRAKLTANLRRYPLEVEIRECYRVVLETESQFDTLVTNIGLEVERLSDPAEKVHYHMNLLSGATS